MQQDKGENMFRSIRDTLFFAIALIVLATAALGVNNPATDSSSNDGTTASETSLGPIKQINAGLLNVGYAEAGPANGTPVILLHGWPYDIHSFVRCRPNIGFGGLPRFRAVRARLWQHSVSFG